MHLLISALSRVWPIVQPSIQLPFQMLTGNRASVCMWQGNAIRMIVISVTDLSVIQAHCMRMGLSEELIGEHVQTLN